jgi:hypothetical protein
VLRVGQLWRTSGPLADAESVNERAPGIGAWGEGLVDRSLTSLWYPADWSEVGDDELVFLLPTLSTWRPGRVQAPARANDGPVRYLTRILAARASATAALISSNTAGNLPMTPARALERLVRRDILTAIRLEELAPAKPGAARKPRFACTSEEQEQTTHGLPEWLALELTALAHLDRLLLDARGTNNGGSASPLVDWPLSLSDVVLASINARLNAAYVHPEFAHAHELLTAAALLGHLAGGREALIPPHIAQSLVDLLSGDAEAASGEDDWCAPILRMYAELAGGAEHILGFAGRAAASGRPCLARPRHPEAPSDTGRTTWNARLLQRIAGRWHVSA